MRMTDVVVFLGPSLPADAARRIVPDATILPPVRLGDVSAAVYRGAEVIVVIDGFFEQVPTVWHKELLWALSQGIWVYGAASMGALRAAELARFGMRGVGTIFERYASGVYTDDDEVAIVHAPAEERFRPMSVAMVNLRDGLERAGAEGVVTEAELAALLGAAKRLHYPDRSWRVVLTAARELGLGDSTVRALDDFLRRVQPDAKAEDAAAALRAVTHDLAGGFRPRQPDFALEATNSFEKLQRIVRAELTEMALARRYRRSSAQLRKELPTPHLPLFYLLVEQEAERLGIQPDPAADGVVEALALRHGVPTGTAAQLVRLRSLTAQLEEHYAGELAGFTEAALCHPPGGQDEHPEG
jgi:hypothetical protein